MINFCAINFFFSRFLSIFLNIFVKSNYRYFCKNWYFHSWSWPLFKGLASRVGSTTVEIWFLMKWSTNQVLEKYFHLVFNKELKKYYLGYEEEKKSYLIHTPNSNMIWSSFLIFSLLLSLYTLLNDGYEDASTKLQEWRKEPRIPLLMGVGVVWFFPLMNHQPIVNFKMNLI